MPRCDALCDALQCGSRSGQVDTCEFNYTTKNFAKTYYIYLVQEDSVRTVKTYFANFIKFGWVGLATLPPLSHSQCEVDQKLFFSWWERDRGVFVQVSVKNERIVYLHYGDPIWCLSIQDVFFPFWPPITVLAMQNIVRVHISVEFRHNHLHHVACLPPRHHHGSFVVG